MFSRNYEWIILFGFVYIGWKKKYLILSRFCDATQSVIVIDNLLHYSHCMYIENESFKKKIYLWRKKLKWLNMWMNIKIKKLQVSVPWQKNLALVRFFYFCCWRSEHRKIKYKGGLRTNKKTVYQCCLFGRYTCYQFTIWFEITLWK